MVSAIVLPSLALLPMITRPQSSETVCAQVGLLCQEDRGLEADTHLGAVSGSASVATVTATSVAGTSTILVSTGTNSAGSLVTETITGGTPGTVAVAGIVVATTNSAGSTYTTTLITSSSNATNATTVTTTNSAGSTVTTIIGAGAANATGASNITSTVTGSAASVSQSHESCSLPIYHLSYRCFSLAWEDQELTVDYL